MTGGKASCDSIEGGDFSAWDGYISGINKKLVPNSLIMQSWRTTEFGENDEDSLIEIQFNKVENGTELVLIHSNIPEGQPDYESGWKDHYFSPMSDYFS